MIALCILLALSWMVLLCALRGCALRCRDLEESLAETARQRQEAYQAAELAQRQCFRLYLTAYGLRRQLEKEQREDWWRGNGEKPWGEAW